MEFMCSHTIDLILKSQAVLRHGGYLFTLDIVYSGHSFILNMNKILCEQVREDIVYTLLTNSTTLLDSQDIPHRQWANVESEN